MQHLKRIWKQIPLKRLKQGSSLSIKSKILNNNITHVTFQPSWRDDGLVTLQQIIDTTTTNPKDFSSSSIINMNIQQDNEIMTSLGRMETHVSIELLAATNNESSTTTTTSWSTTVVDALNKSIASSLKPKPIDKIMLNDGTTIESINDDVVNIASDATTIRTDYYDGIAHIQKQQQNKNNILPGHYLTIDVPEKINLDCDISDGTIIVTDKVEGDVTFKTNHGDIIVKKLRGHNINLENNNNNDSYNNGVIYASSLLEAQKLSIKTNNGGRFRAKQVHGNTININVQQKQQQSSSSSSKGNIESTLNNDVKIMDKDDDEGSIVDISSLFVSSNDGAIINVENIETLPRRAVRIKTHHGHVNVTSNNNNKPTNINPITKQRYPIIELGGVNGSCEVTINNNNNNNKSDFSKNRDQSLNDDEQDFWSSCLVHVDSLLQDTVSLIAVEEGDITLTMDRKVEADIRLASVPNNTAIDSGYVIIEEDDIENIQNELDDMYEDNKTVLNKKDNNNLILIDTKSFTKRDEIICNNKITLIDGWVENKSHEPDSRFEQKVRGSHESGANTGIGKIRLEGAARQALNSFTSQEEEGVYKEKYVRPLLAVAGTNKITLETVSWLGAIARRYGLEDENGPELGRTASRKGRAFISESK